MSRIQTNVAANNAYRNLSVTSQGLEKSIQKLSSGFRINRAADDAAGLAIANKLRSDVRSLQAASRNAAQGTAMLQIADGAIGTISQILDRMKELATQANSASIGNEAGKLDAEYQKLLAEIDRIVNTTQYQGKTLLNGSFGVTVNTSSTALAASNVTGITTNAAAAGSYTIASDSSSATLTAATGTQIITGLSTGSHLNFSKFGITVVGNANLDASALNGTNITLGATSTADFMVSSSGQYSLGTGDLVSLSAVDVRTSTLGVSGTNLNSQSSAQTALAAIDTAIGKVNTAIGDLGAAMNRMDYASSAVATMIQNASAAESVIRDADMAYEMTVFTKNQILQQAGTAMLAQANAAPQQILSLLRG
ncbi:MAG TPA: flagellin [Gemmatimonadales bacterium]|nr:flagellin [Gemmatimonadales bacterium]